MESIKSNDRISLSTPVRMLTPSLIFPPGNVSATHDNNVNNINRTESHSPKKNQLRTWSLWSTSNHSVDGISTNALDASNLNHQEHQNDRLTVPKQKSPGPSYENPDIRNRGWSFLSRKSNNIPAPGSSNDNISNLSTLPISNLAKPLTNTMIFHSDIDFLLGKSKIDSDLTDEDTKSLNESIVSPNIVVPCFDILPKTSAWSSLALSLTKVATSLNILSKEKKQMCLNNQGPNSKLYELSNKGKNPISVLLIGVHGFFPTKMIRPFIGEPTGTSSKFISEAEKIVIRYFKKHNQPIEINKIALEREGRVFDRVEFFYETLKNWADEINKADFIYFVAHSQGCPVTVILLGKLIEDGIIKTNNIYYENYEDIPGSSSKKVISILAMAGVNNGPFYGADQTLFVRAYSTIESDSLQELFEFQKFDSIQSRKFIQNLRILIASNVKITFVGSINDQLVPLYSSICLFVHHANIFRATFIDKGSRTPSFITRIVDIAGKLIDLGYDDHGIIKEISASLAGPLTGGGHSTVYNEAQVYELGLKFALETTDLEEETPVVYTPYKLSQLGTNPYNLPWCMRGLLFESNKHLEEKQIKTLIKEFEDWEPNTKALKDIKYRLNGLKSKL